MDTVEITPVEVGSPVRIVDERYGEHAGLVTCVHGKFSDGFAPCINVVYVSGDDAETDPYGRQVKRMTSVQHYSQGPDKMPRPGRYWTNV